MKIALVKPRIGVAGRGNVFPPLNLLHIASALGAAGHRITVIDQQTLGMTRGGLAEAIESHSPDAVGFTSMTYEIPSMFADVSMLRKRFPDMPIVVGGSHVSSLPERTLRECRGIDSIVVGEGEQTAVSLFESLRDRKSCEELPGVAFWDGDTVRVNRPVDPVSDLDLLPLPDYGAIPLDDYRYSQRGWSGRRFMSVATSRGCPFGCTFCARAVFGRKVRFHSGAYIAEQFSVLRNRFGVSGIGIMDDTFTLNKERVLDFCARLERSALGVIWFCFSSVNTIDRDMLAAMRRAGCVKISYGVESGDPEIQRHIGKNLDFERVREAFALTREAGIESLAFFMVGNKGETMASLARSRALARELNPDFINVAVLCPLPGSAVYEEFKEHLPTDWTRYQITPFRKLPALRLGEIDERELQRQMRRFYRSFYLRPRYLLSRLRKVASLADLRFYLSKALSVVREWF